MKNLALAFCSIRPKQLTDSICDYREHEYFRSIQQIERILPDSFDLVVCENTIDDEKQLKNRELAEYLSNIEMVSLGSSGNIGTVNKGMGELLMLSSALEELDIDKYVNITYISARHLLTCPYVFERTERLQKDAIISNPDFVMMDGTVEESHKGGLYNDMIFSMKSKTMREYSDYSKKYVSFDQRQVGSEQILFNFINENDIEYEWLDTLGVIRNDWQKNGKILDVNNFHIC